MPEVRNGHVRHQPKLEKGKTQNASISDRDRQRVCRHPRRTPHVAVHGALSGRPQGRRLVTENTVEGYYDGDPAQPGAVRVKDIIGPYEAQAELVKAKEEAEAKQRAEQAALKGATKKLLTKLYEVTGLKPDEENDYRSPFRNSFGTNVDIRPEGIIALLAYLEGNERDVLETVFHPEGRT